MKKQPSEKGSDYADTGDDDNTDPAGAQEGADYADVTMTEAPMTEAAEGADYQAEDVVMEEYAGRDPEAVNPGADYGDEPPQSKEEDAGDS